MNVDGVVFPVESVQAMLFARAVGQEPSDGGVTVVPPTFTEVRQQFIPGYAWRPHHGQPWVGSGASASGTPTHESTPAEVVLHAEQHFEYRRHVRVGDVLTASTRPGRSWEKSSRQGHTLAFREIVTEFADERGEVAVISTAVEVTVPAGGSGT
ncbi:MAG: hypothetical protein JWP31_1145 [Aeromicrobium sp.]|nr:hypothetical protein [Aeromicrobium sp.]